MGYYAAFDNEGRCVQAGYCQDGEENNQVPGRTTILGQYDPSGVYLDNGVVKEFPPKPNEFSYWDYPTKQWVTNTDAAWESVRIQQIALLQASDYTQLPDVPYDNKEAWAVYRQELRDVTQQPDPLNIVWPTPPK